MSTPKFSRSELAAAFEKFEATVDAAARSQDWDAWVQHYTPDVLYIDAIRIVPRPPYRVEALDILLIQVAETPYVVEGAHALKFTVVKDAGLSLSLYR